MIKTYCRIYLFMVHAMNHPFTGFMLDKLDDVLELAQHVI